MENHKNIKYKKKYNKYKNKYYKIIQNHQIKGGSEGISIIAVILTIIALVGLGTGIYMNNETIKSWFDSNYELIKKRIQNLRRVEQIDILKKQNEQLKIQEIENKISNTQNELQIKKNDDRNVQFAKNKALLDEKKREYEEEQKIIAELEKKQTASLTVSPAASTPASSTVSSAAAQPAATLPPQQPPQQQSVEVPISDNKQGLILKNVETPFNEMRKPAPKTYYSELDSMLIDDNKKFITIPKRDYLNTGIKNVTIIENPITKQKELHWDFNTRHFYWTPNRNKEDKTVLIKYYPRFGDPNDISVYKLLTANTFTLFEKNIEQLLPKENTSTQPAADPTQQPTPPPPPPATAEKGPTISIIKPADKTLDNTDQSKNYLTNLGLEFLYNNIKKEETEKEEIVKEFLSFMNDLKDNYEEQYIQHLSRIIDKNMLVEQNINLTTQKISGDGLCQFYSIIHQLQRKKEEELETLKTKYNDNKSFEGDLKNAIQDFIQDIINVTNKEGFNNTYPGEFRPQELAEKLKNIMIMFINKHYSKKMQYCRHEGRQQTEEEITYEEAIKMFNFKNVEQFNEYYGKEKNNWGDDLTLSIIAAIFNLKINLYEKRDDKYIKTTRQPLYLVDNKECQNPVEIKLLYANMSGKKDENGKELPANHYESVINVT